MTKKGLTIVLVIACVLSIAGVALATTAWFTGATNKDTTLGIGDKVTMELTNVQASGKTTNMYPGDIATIALKANNKDIAATLTVKLMDSADGEGTDYSSYFTITYSMGETSDAAYDSGISVAANANAQDVTLKIQLKSDAEDDIAGKTIYVIISLDKAAA